jgi:phosphate transport system substrate-binding protein
MDKGMNRCKAPKRFWTGLIFSVMISLLGCQRHEEGITIVGSTSVQPFVEMLAEEYMLHHPQEKIFIQGGGSSAGIQAVQTQAAQVGMSSRNLTSGEKELIAVPVAYDAIAVVVHPRNPLNNLSIEQIQRIFSGQVLNWKEVGGTNHSITLVSREEGSGTREAFQHIIMGKQEINLGALIQDSNGAIRQVVKDDRNAIGYISLGLVNETVKALKIDGIEPDTENIKAKRYKVVRPFLFVFKKEPNGAGKNFLDYVLSPAAQNLLMKEGLVNVNILVGSHPEVRGPGNV